MNLICELCRLLLVGAACFFVASCQFFGENDAMIVNHKIDTKVWTQKTNAPGTRVLFNYKAGEPVFGKYLNSRGLSSVLANGTTFGVINGRTVAIVRQGAVTKLTARDAEPIAAHEAFHMAIQFMTLRPRFDSAETPVLEGDKDIETVQEMSWNLFDAIQSGTGVCRVAKEVMESREIIRKYFIERAYVEWPAEWYMRHSALRDASFKSYLDYRTSWGGGHPNMLYVVGVIALDKVDHKLGRNSWQAGYMSGEHPFNMLLKVYGCGKAIGDSFQVTSQQLLDIFE